MYERHRARYRVRYREQGGEWKRAYTSDVSVMGIFLARVRPPTQNDLEIEIDLPSGTVNMQGSVVRKKTVHLSLRCVEGGDGFAIKLDAATLCEEWYAFCLAWEQKRTG